jgi:transglutaminase-like putative cysteine protease
MSKFSIRHITRYLYEVPVRDSANQIMLYPLKDDYQEVLEHKIMITGDPVVDVHLDYFGNEVGIFTHSQPHQELLIDSQLVVVTRAKIIKEDIIPAEHQWEELKKLKNQIPYINFFKLEPFDALPEVEKVVAMEGGKKLTPLKTAQKFCEYVYTNFKYKSGITTVETKLEEIWKLKSGVCQDFAHFLLAILRLEGIPARYVSGYICPNKNGMRGEGATHAWVEIYIPSQGWVGLDPTNNSFVEGYHVN